MVGMVEIERRGRVAIAWVENPPVNALSHGVRQGLAEAVATLNGDATLGAMVIACRGRTFMAGADIREFGGPIKDPQLGDVIDTIEASGKPVIAAIHGQALGGGFEVALGCHFRVAVPAARVGLPEVKLGILPGAGGTQRLPRLVDAATALKMVVEARELGAAEARQLGVLDAVIDGDLADGAVAFANAVLDEARPLRRLCDVVPQFPDAALFEEAARNAEKRQRGFIAPLECIRVVRLAYEVPFREGLKQEYSACVTLMRGEQSRAQRHMFAAERIVAKLPGLEQLAPRRIEGAAVVGPGSMGVGIAACFANAGIPTHLLGRSQASLDRGMAALAKIYAGLVTRGSLAQATMDARLALVTPTLDYADLAAADVVVEAVSEELETKRAVFRALDAACKPGAILASNTSYLSIDRLADATSRPQDVAGTHFFTPAHLMRLLENVRGAQTAPDVQVTLMELGRRLGKLPVMVGACEGFVANRMLARRSREGIFLMEEGATPWQIDRVLSGFGFPLGPYALADLGGLDVQHAVRRARFAGLTPREQRRNILDTLVERGRFGQKTGIGYYRYDAKRNAAPDAEVETLIAELSATHGVTRRSIEDQEILERCLFAMINEGARILEVGVTLRPHEIDVIWVHGLGFPLYRGGPMFYADQLGLAHVRDRMRHYAETVGPEYFAPARLIETLAEQGRGFYDQGQ